MSADGFLPTAERELLSALVGAAKTDPDVQSIFGVPARIFEDEPERGTYPFAFVSAHETTPSGGVSVDGAVHRVTMVVKSRHGGRAEAREALGVLRAAIERAELILSGQRVVLVLPVYSDVLRSRNLRSFRGLLRLRVVTEEVPS
ncbi:MAG: DUF3168 domain-containing protein [Pseudomonadota bacterium]